MSMPTTFGDTASVRIVPVAAVDSPISSSLLRDLGNALCLILAEDTTCPFQELT